MSRTRQRLPGTIPPRPPALRHAGRGGLGLPAIPAGARPRAVVVGGGIGGIAAALLLADRGLAVELVEAGPRLGAGWASTHTPAGPADPGLRVPMESGLARADALVLHADPALAWHRLGRRPRAGHVAGGRLRTEADCLDARFLGPGALAAAEGEMLARALDPDPGPAAPDLAARLEAVFGPTLLALAFRPACRALFGAEPEALAATAAEGRLPARVVLAERDGTELLRKVGALGARLARPGAEDAPADGRSHLYPRAGGIGAWLAALEGALARAGVAVRLGCRLAGLRMTGGRVAAARPAEGPDLPCDLLVLAAPPGALPLPGLPAVPERRLPVAARLLRVTGGAPPRLHWLTGYDPALPFLRLGFPDRLEGREPAPGTAWRILAELPAPPGGAPGTAALRAALEDLGLLPRGAAVEEVPAGGGSLAVETAEAAVARQAAFGMLGGVARLAVLRAAAGVDAPVHEMIAEAARLAEAAATAPAGP